MKKSIFIFSVLFSCTALFAQSADFSGDLETLWGVTAPWTDSETAGDFSAGDSSFTGKIDAYSGNSSLLLDGTVGYDSVQKNLYAQINEAYLDYSSAFWGIRIGRQKLVWGKADGINITNSVFPENSTSLFIDDSSLAVDAMRFSVTGNFFTADACWIPFSTMTALPLEETNPLRKYIVPSSVSFSSNGTDFNLPVYIGELTEPELKLKNGEYGLKLSGYFSFCDVSVYGFYGWDKAPLLNYTINTIPTEVMPGYTVDYPQSITVSGQYKRMAMTGFDAAVPVGPVVLRAEAAFFPERYMQAAASEILSGGENSIKKNNVMALAGFDWMPSGWTITAQYYCDYVFGGVEKLNRSEEYEHGATLSISKTLLNETLSLSLSGMLGLNDFDSAVVFSADYSLSDQISLAAGCYAFIPGPEKDGNYGAYKDLSTIYIKAKFSF